MIHQAKSNPQLLDEQIFSERLHPRFLLLGTFRTWRDIRVESAFGVKPDLTIATAEFRV
jgi:hypothetical protein